MNNEAVLVIDMLRDFVYGSLKCDRAWRIIPSIKRLLSEARVVGIPVVYVGDAHLSSDPEIGLWGFHAMKNSDGAKIIDELIPAEKDYVLEKRTYSAFYETGLDLLLRRLGVSTVGDGFKIFKLFAFHVVRSRRISPLFMSFLLYCCYNWFAYEYLCETYCC